MPIKKDFLLSTQYPAAVDRTMEGIVSAELFVCMTHTINGLALRWPCVLLIRWAGQLSR